MPEVKIGVAANADNVAKAVDKVTASLNKLGAAVASASGVKFEPVDVKYAERDLALINRQFQEALKQSAALRNSLKNSGQSGKSFTQVDWTKTHVDQKLAQKMRDRAFNFSTQGTAWDMTNFDAEARAPDGSRPGGRGGRIGRNESDRHVESGGRRVGRVIGQGATAFTSGVGGLGGKVVGGAIEGAGAGAAEGGLMGGMGGLMKGGIAALVVGGLLEAGKMVNQGVDLAKQRDLGVDGLKRSMGDLGISFDSLRDMTDKASDGLGMNASEFAQLEATQQNAAHGGYRSPLELASDSKDAAGFARSYGMDPGQSGAFFGGMHNLRDPRANNKELSVMIAEAIQRTGGRALAADVMQAAMGFASSTSRNSLSSTGVDNYLGAYGSMLQNGGPGMTSDAAGQILGQANSAMMGMGGAGEAGQNFILQAFNKQGMMNPVEARALAAGGMFADRGGVFGENTDLGKYMIENGQGAELKRLRGAGADVSNFMSVRNKLNSDEQDPWLRLDAAQRIFELSTPQQAAALMRLDGTGYGDLQKTVEGAGVKMSDLNASGINTLSQIGGASSMGDLSKIYGQIKGRAPGAGALTDDERSQLDTAQQTGNAADFKSALVRIMASKDQEDTEGNDIRKQTAAMENVQIAVGEKMVPMLNDIRGALLSMAGVTGKSSTIADLRMQAGLATGEIHGNGMFDDGTSAGALRHWSMGKATGNAAGDDSVATAMNYFQSVGWTKDQAAGISANLYTESGMDPTASGDKGNAYGIGQWHDDRQAAFKKWSGHDIHKSTQAEQLAFVNYELTEGAEKAAGDKIKGATSAGQAGALTSLDYERPYDAEGEASRRADMAGAIASSAKVPKSKDKTEKSNAADGKGAVDTVIIDMNINLAQPNGSGGTTQHKISTSVAVPRGSGSQSAVVNN